jgi:hypothetical protein
VAETSINSCLKANAGVHGTKLQYFVSCREEKDQNACKTLLRSPILEIVTKSRKITIIKWIQDPRDAVTEDEIPIIIWSH